MTDLTAIDILVEPDGTALDRAAACNIRLRAEYPGGFPLDDTHKPHITLLQRYVRSAELGQVFTTVETVLRRRDLNYLAFRATALRHMPVAALPGVGIAAVVATPSQAVLATQSALLEALKPFTASGGTAEAFETTPQDPEINIDTLAYVETYVPEHSGPNYVCHLTVGLAPLAFLDRLEAQPFDAFGFSPAAVAVFKLGNNGTARKRLRAWTVAQLSR